MLGYFVSPFFLFSKSSPHATWPWQGGGTDESDADALSQQKSDTAEFILMLCNTCFHESNKEIYSLTLSKCAESLPAVSLVKREATDEFPVCSGLASCDW